MRAKSASSLIAMIVVAASLVPGPAMAEETAQEIVEAAVDRNSTGFQVGVGEMTLFMENKAGDKKVRKLHVSSKQTSDGLQRILVRLLSPDEVKGQAFLFKEVRGAEDLVYWYLPAFGGPPRRISGDGKRGSFMGTHLSFSDVESRDVKDANYKRLPSQSIGEHEVHVIEAIPKKGDDSDYGKVVLYIRKTDKMPLKIRFYGKRGKEAKVLFTEKIDKRGDRTYVKQMTVRPVEGGFTRLTVDAIDFDKEIPDVLFTPEALANE